MKRTIAITIGLLIIVSVVLALSNRRFLKGDILSDDVIAWNLREIADTNDDGSLTAKEIRTALVFIIRRVFTQSSEGDVDGDGTVDREDIRAGTKGFRALLLANCGNGVRDAGEQCDDGNRTPGDGCDEVCRTSYVCGNGVTDPGETCDDGNTEDADGCSATCVASFVWHPERLGNGTWYDIRELCQNHVARGKTAWALPSVTDLHLIQPEIARLGLTGTVWTNTHAQPLPGGQSTFRTWNLGTGQMGQPADPNVETFAGLCITPAADFYSCTDGDRPAGTISYDQYIREAIFTPSTLNVIQGTQQTFTRDICSANTLREQLCPFIVDQGYEVAIDCPYGCVDGACFRNPPTGFTWPYPAAVSNGSPDPDGTVIGSGLQTIGAFKIQSTDPIDITQMTVTINLQNVRLRSMTPPDENQVRRRHITVTTDRTGSEIALTCSDADTLDEIVGPGLRQFRCWYGGSVPTRVGPNTSTIFTIHGELIPVQGASNPSVQISWHDFNDPFFKPDTDIGVIGSQSNILLINHRISKRQYYLPALQEPVVTSTRYSIVP